jgi:uncharacterized protein YecE (DUF72 family)
MYVSGYSDRALDRWATRIAAWHRGAEPADARRVIAADARPSGPRDVFCYFDNTDIKLRAPVDAQNLMRKLGLVGVKSGRRVVGEVALSPPRLPRAQAERIVSGFLQREARRSAQR